MLPEIGICPPAGVLLYESAKFISSDVFDHELTADQALDAMLDRATKRLIQVKTSKMLGRKPVKTSNNRLASRLSGT
jgi:hypothetical protein